VRLTGRIDALDRRLPPARTVPDEGGAMRKLCELLERHAPIPAGETYADVDARMDAALDRLHLAGLGISAGPNTSRMERFAAVYGMSVQELRAEWQARARGDAP
jgi:hypothetical protein